MVQKQKDRVWGLDRVELTRGRDKQESQEKENRVPLLITYNQALSSMMRVVQVVVYLQGGVGVSHRHGTIPVGTGPNLAFLLANRHTFHLRR